MKLLVPVDLYDTTHAPFEYAMQLGQLIDAEITLLHIINSVYNTNEVIAYDPYVEMEDSARKRLGDFKANFLRKNDGNFDSVNVKIEVMFGLPGVAISEYSESNKIDMIIMGVRDKHGLFDRMLGSASSETIKEAKCPVLLIHSSTEFKKPERALFAFDKKTDLDDALEDFKEINNILKAKTDFLHINVKETDDI
ncbi:MAG: universal stress protein, partial [Saprospiraceae bacterium]|nr:universal stress protein [Saprospiraceae bacterium]